MHRSVQNALRGMRHHSLALVECDVLVASLELVLVVVFVHPLLWSCELCFLGVSLAAAALHHGTLGSSLPKVHSTRHGVCFSPAAFRGRVDDVAVTCNDLHMAWL